MIRSKIINLEEIQKSKRFDCSFYINIVQTIETLENSNYPLKILSDESLTNLITDGEHQALTRFEKGKFRYLYGRNLKEGFVNMFDISDLPYITEEDYKRSERIQGSNKDVLLAIKGTVGKSAVYNKDYMGEVALPREIAKIVTNKENLLPEYLCIFLLSKYGRIQTSGAGSGNIHPLLTLTRLRKIIIPVLPMPLQETISNIYNQALEKEVESLKKILFVKNLIEQEIEDKIKSENSKVKTFIINKSELNPIWTPENYQPQYKDTWAKIVGNFDCPLLHEEADIIKGNEVGSENYKDYFEKDMADVPFIRTTDISNFEIDNYSDYYIEEEIFQDLSQDIENGDILFTNDGKIGLVALVLDFDKCIIQSHIRGIRSHGRIDQEYIFAFLLTKFAKHYFNQNTVIQSTIPTTRNSLYFLPIPLLKDATIDLIVQNISEVKQLKNDKKLLLLKAKQNLEDAILNSSFLGADS